VHRTIVAAATDRVTARATLGLAVALGRPFGAQIALIGIVARESWVPSWQETRIEVLCEHLRKVAGEGARDVHVDVDGIVAPTLADGVRRAADHHHAQLLVLARSAPNVMERALHGDPDAAAMRTVNCGIAFAAPSSPSSAPLQAPRRIGVAWDDSPEAGEALEWAVQLAERTGGSIEIVHLLRDDEDDAEAAGRLEGLRRAVEPRAPAVATIIDGVAPASQLARLTSELDLLVMGSRRGGSLRDRVLGSMSRTALHATHCHLVVLPRGVHAPVDTAAV